MNVVLRSALTVVFSVAPVAMTLAQDLNPGNSGGGHAPIAVPTYGSEQPVDPALTTGSRFSTPANTPSYENPTVAGATGNAVVPGDNSTISSDRRATTQQKTGGSASDAPG